MHIDLRTVNIEPLRQTFDHIAARIGPNKPASRYLEGTMDVQAAANYHYRPTWDPEHEIFDATRTAITMKDWYALKDPRQLYYGSYTASRARMQETTEADFEFVETRGLAEVYDETARRTALDFYIPLRHVAWGANMNGASMCAYGFGTAITQPCLYQGMDQLGVAQYLTRMGLVLGDESEVQAAKQAWMDAPQWQELRRYVEDTLVIKDWFEMFVAQHVALDAMLFGLAYKEVDQALNDKAGPTVSLLTRFQTELLEDSSKWVDACLKTAAAENHENKAQLQEWIAHWRGRAAQALQPLAQQALGADADAALARVSARLDARLVKAGLLA
ncbi:phenol hydroxylase P1 protein [Rhodoferax lithotrophicus]|uniref:Phenol hydroxylase P1 protein n=1 Tax=Rhodoferax lithotrophicus TaxID=2798804 RepID=A0ABM7MIY4_9BURK|nr:aromatic/alkene monooxygenase hydroxylase subunit beta [Rhodoferax sp. MIZ03]BCO26132.1 phenol hydroxylase P1 protein [Rhodoferax sp. MIZ03]